jgi:hypothetical protein
MKKRFLIPFTLLAIIVTACSQLAKDSTTFSGRLIVSDPDFYMPAADDAIYLVPITSDQTVIGVPTLTLGTDLQADVDERTGEFTFKGVKPGKYIVLVVTTTNEQVPAHLEDGTLAVIDVTDADLGKKIDLKLLFIP